jgi:drug/metabolite transporter (DMT)-like permease
MGDQVMKEVERRERVRSAHIQSKLGIPIAVITIMTCFAANSVITRYLVLGNYVSPFTLTVIRFGSGLVMLQILSLLMPRTFQKARVRRSHILGALFLGIYAFSISYGYAFISAAAGVLIFYAFVVFTMTLFSVINDRERLTHRLIVGQLLGIMGVLVITASGIKSVTLIGAFLMTATGISWGLYSVYGRRFENPFGYTYNSFLIFGFVASALFIIAYPFFERHLWIDISLYNLGLVFYLGMVSTALSYALWNRLMNRIRASQGGMAQLLVPVLAALMGVLLLGEEVTSSLVLGGTSIILGISLNTLPTNLRHLIRNDEPSQGKS